MPLLMPRTHLDRCTVVAENHYARGGYGAPSAADQLRAAYDEAPYESYAHPLSAPGHLAATAWLFGLDTPDVDTARVLEIGCAAAGNLIPFAATHPRASVVGIDLSPVQISQGRERVRALGLANVQLVEGDIARVDLERWGQFDFIVCHGVYSWVPDDVQAAILATCRKLLSADGVAYVSYNVYPGWKAKEIVRDAMLLGVGDAADAADKVGRARAMIHFLQKVANPDSVLGHALADQSAMASETGDYYLLHEELEMFNSPCYFREFARRAHTHGLDYLADAQPEYMFARNYGQTAVDQLVEAFGDDQVLLEQHLDFVVNRSHRQTLLVHRERAPRISHAMDRNRNRRLHIAAWVPPGEARDPVTKAGLDALNARWPWTLSWPELLGAAAIAEPLDPAAQVDSLVELLIMQGRARFRLEPVSAPPVSTPIRLPEQARRMAELTREGDEAVTFNRWHESVPLSPLDRHLLPLLDGTHDREALLEAAVNLFRQNVIRIERDDEELVDEVSIRQVLAEEVDAMSQRLVELKLLGGAVG
jgi:SAM-dependent methyltransferase